MDETHVGGHQVLDPVAEDGVGVSAAELHQAVVPARVRLCRNGRRKPPGQVPIAKFVDVFQDPASPDTPASFEEPQGAVGFVRADLVQRVAHVHQHVVADTGIVHQGERHLFADASERYGRGIERTVDGGDLCGDG